MNDFVSQKAEDALFATPKAYPCEVQSVNANGTQVTVKFLLDDDFGKEMPQVTIPVLICHLLRFPIQVGDNGVARPIDSGLARACGIDGVSSAINKESNLSNLIFEPIGHADWGLVNPNYVTVLTKLSDNAYMTTITQINTAYEALRIAHNTHTHPSGGVASVQVTAKICDVAD